MLANVNFLPRFVRWFAMRTLQRTGYQLVNVRKIYQFDGLHTIHHARFLDNEKFQSAWERGLQASDGVDSCRGWRLHIGLWAASVAARVPGDFIECGVNAGFLSSAILRYLDWRNLQKKFYLVDTFAGPVLEQLSAAEIERGLLESAKARIAAGAYVTDLERIRHNYEEWDRVVLVQGTVPTCCEAVNAESVAFLHLDMNCAYPEVEALRFFWDRVNRGGIILFDDYTHFGYENQGNAIDDLAKTLGTEILALPTGQGMMVK